MSDNPTPPATRTRDKPEKKYHATLQRGMNYIVNRNGKLYRFTKGKRTERPIPEDVKQYLEETATDPVTLVDGDENASTEHRQKFVFEEA